MGQEYILDHSLLTTSAFLVINVSVADKIDTAAKCFVSVNA